MLNIPNCLLCQHSWINETVNQINRLVQKTPLLITQGSRTAESYKQSTVTTKVHKIIYFTNDVCEQWWQDVCKDDRKYQSCDKTNEIDNMLIACKIGTNALYHRCIHTCIYAILYICYTLYMQYGKMHNTIPVFVTLFCAA